MSQIVPSDKIEGLVGTSRHPKYHLGRLDSSTETMYILHSKECVLSGIDLRTCEYSKALDQELPEKIWESHQDKIILLGIMQERLIPAAILDENWKCIGF